jgi:hypothetical protein
MEEGDTRFLGEWPTPSVCWDAGYRPLAEAAVPSDRLASSGGIEAVTYPPAPDDEAEFYASRLFSDALEMFRAPNPEIPDTIDEMDRRNSADSGLAGLAPQYVTCMTSAGT